MRNRDMIELVFEVEEVKRVGKVDGWKGCLERSSWVDDGDDEEEKCKAGELNVFIIEKKFHDGRCEGVTGKSEGTTRSHSQLPVAS